MMDEDWRVVVSLLPQDWEQCAAQTGALKGLHRNKSNCPSDVLRVLLIHLACGYSMRETVVRARAGGLTGMSDVALLKRLRKCGPWLRALCVSLLRERGALASPGVDAYRMRVFDATVVKEPGRTGSQWRVHYSMELPSLECDYFEVTPCRGAGNGEAFGRFPVRTGDLVLADAGYSHVAGLKHIVDAGASVCVRLNPSLVALQAANGHCFDLVRRIASIKEPGQIRCWRVAVQLGEDLTAQARLCVIRKSEEAIRQAHRRVKRRAQLRQREAKQSSLVLAQYVVVLTTLPEEGFPAAHVLELYRRRWQVELVFKRLKQIAQLGHLPKRDSESSKAWLYGKMFAALMTDKLAAHAATLSPWGYALAAWTAGEPMAGVHVHVPPAAAGR